MGSAAIELSKPGNPAEATGSADDLLAQLAGDEIDRLLAEADVEPAPLDPLADETPVANEEVDEALAAAATVPTPVATPGPEAAVDADPLGPQLDELFSELNKGNTKTDASAELPASMDTDSAAPVVAEAPAAGDAIAPAAESSDAAPIHPVEEELRLEEEQKLAAAAKPQSDEIAETPADDDAPAALSAYEDDAQLPIFLRPLEWLSRPLEAWSPAVREALGKAAIVTMVNALGVLIYVLAFRRHR